MGLKDKIVFLLGNDFTHYCLAYALQKKYHCESYAIVETTDRPRQFLENQKLVNFEKKWFFHDHIKRKSEPPNLEYLSQFEKKYNINLWKLAQNERVFLYYQFFHKFTDKEILSILEQECRFFENILEEIKPDYFFTKVSSLHHQELVYQMCRNSGINVQMLRFANIGRHSMITEDYGKFDYTEESDRSNGSTKSFEDLQKYLHSFDLLKQVENKILKPGSSRKETIMAAMRFFLSFNEKNLKTHYTYYGRTRTKVLFYYINEYIKTKLRKSFIDKNFRKETDFIKPFVYFPFHTEMERSLLINAPYYVNQVEIVKWVAKSLPINFKLYVKEHPAQVGRSWRPISAYKEIINIPNVVVLHPEFPNDEIYRNCSLLITISGTAGFEALFYGKPVITFVDMNYSMLPSVSTLKNVEDLSSLIRESLDKKVNPQDLDNYVSLLEKNLCRFNWAEFMEKLANEFFYGGNLLDVDISESKMKEFLLRNYSDLESLADEHIKKMNFFKEKGKA